MPFESMEDLAVYLANYNCLRWHDLDEKGKDHYRHLAKLEQASREREKKRVDTQPMYVFPRTTF
jgi:hypothetical protein